MHSEEHNGQFTGESDSLSGHSNPPNNFSCLAPSRYLNPEPIPDMHCLK